jgi:hypothetical protein
MKTFIELAGMVQRNPDNRTVDVLIGNAIDLIAYGDIGIRKSLAICGLEELAKDADDQGNIWFNKLPRYTSSYDAVMSLVVPGSQVRIEHGNYENGTGWAYVYMNTPVGEMTGEAEAGSELIALLSAMLFARGCNPDFTRLSDEDVAVVGGVLHA